MRNSSNEKLVVKLTDDQNESLKTFSLWLEKEIRGEPFVLRGYAGSGKTFLAMKFLKLVEAQKLCWTVAAPTHKAVGVLRTALQTEGLRPTWYPSTIHRLLRLKLKRKGEIEFCEETKQTLNSLNDLALIIIDESSMIDSTLLEIILKCSHYSNTRLVFVGDPAQLPPVGEEESPVFLMNEVYTAQLDEVVRHQGPILDLASCIRDGSLPCNTPPYLPSFKSSYGLVASLEKKSWLDKAKSSLKAASENNNPDESRILCYTNRILEKLVPHARRAIHGDLADQMPVLPGEILITIKPVMRAASVNLDDVGEDVDMLISSNREMVVLDITPESCDLRSLGLIEQVTIDNPSIDTLIARIRCEEREFSIRLLPQVGSRSRRTLDNILRILSAMAKEADKDKRRQLWRVFFLIRDAFASVGPASVLTVHRSQGSTFQKVFVASDVFFPKDLSLRRQLVYVAVSRASEQVWLIGEDIKSSYKEKWENQFKRYF